jgi:hypothetical protein
VAIAVPVSAKYHGEVLLQKQMARGTARNIKERIMLLHGKASITDRGALDTSRDGRNSSLALRDDAFTLLASRS